MKRIAGLLFAVVLAAACGKVFTVPLDEEGKAFYDTARLIMTNAEDAIFRRLPDAGARAEFIVDFWDKRDPDPETPENEFKTEFQRRVDYANSHFNEGKRGINTDRGRVYLYLGPPEKTESYSSAQMQAQTTKPGFTILWIYYTHDVAVIFTEDEVGGGYQISNVTGNLFDAFEDAKVNGFGRLQGPAAPRLQSFTAEYNKEKKEITVRLPVKKVNFREESGTLKADFSFVIYVYKPDGQKDKFEDRRSFEGPVAEVEGSETIAFAFPYDLSPGRNDVDIIVLGGETNGRGRKIFAFTGK
ncbi:MAG: GWxTD domain-containing protein [Candidatus Aminicenantes bacterium]|nr:GWxTD domain-containing protein [Candidatus Aminicenantes bacterium]